MKYLVTGGSGFIGTNVIDRLISLGEEVINIDITPPLNSEHSSYYVNCDIRDYEKLLTVITQFSPDYIIHLAARTDLDGVSITDYDSNTVGVENLCKIVSCLSGLKSIVFASSMLVCRAGYIPSDIYDFSPSTVYGESKMIGENIVREWGGMLPKYFIVRPTSIWGPWFRTPYRDFFDVVLSGRFIDAGPRLCTKTYGFVLNASNQIISLLESNISSDELIYMGDNTPISIRKWAVDISLISGIRLPIRVPFFFFKGLSLIGDFLLKFGISFPMTSFRLKNMTTDNILDCGLLSSINQYSEYSYEESISITINWLKKNKA